MARSSPTKEMLRNLRQLKEHRGAYYEHWKKRHAEGIRKREQRKRELQECKEEIKRLKERIAEKPAVSVFFQKDCCPSERLIITMMRIWGCDRDTFYDTYFEWMKERCKAIERGEDEPPFPYEA